jgi:hypothetical protein
MSNQISTSFIKEFGDGITLLSQQQGSVLREGVMVETMSGEEHFFDQIGATEAQRTSTRHADSPLMNTPHARRRVTPVDIDWGDLIDDFDKLKLLNDPTSSYVQNASYAVGRELDDLVIESFFADADTGKDGTGTASFTAGNIVPVDFDGDGTDEGLTVEKLRNGLMIIRQGEVDLRNPMNKLYCAITAQQLDNLLGTTEVTSSDYNSVKALVSGDVDTFLGIKFLKTERLEADANADRRVPLWAKSGMALAMAKEPTVRLTERPDKRFSMYAYYSTSAGATRLEEKKVVEIICAE